MANAQTYLNHLLQNTGITPSCSEEEREAADIIADIFTEHGFEPEVQEFTAKSTAKIVQAVLGIAVFAGSVLMGMNGIPGYLGVVITIAAAVIYILERMGKHVFSQLGAGGLSQNVIAYHKAEGPLASPRNRPVVVVAHYDSPREDLLYQEPFAKFRPVLIKLLPYCMVAPAVIGIIQLFPLPQSAKTLLWIVAIIVALVPLLDAIAIIANRFILPYTTGAVCNKSSVAAMLGVMDDVAPYQGENEFPEDVPFDEYYNEQVNAHEEELAAIEAERAAKQAAKNGGAEGSEEALEETVEYGDEEDMTESAPDAFGESLSDDLDEAEDLDETLEAVPVQTEPSEGGEADETIVAESSAEAVSAEDGTIDAASGESPAEIPTDETLEIPANELAGTTVDMAEEVAGEPDEEEAAAPTYPYVNEEGNFRFGPEVITALGMLPDSCVLVYPEDISEGEDEDGEKGGFEPPVSSTSRYQAVVDGSQRVAETEPFEVLTGDEFTTEPDVDGGRGESSEGSDWYDEDDADAVEEADGSDISQMQESRSLKARWTDWFAQKRAAHEQAKMEAAAEKEAAAVEEEQSTEADDNASTSDESDVEALDEIGSEVLDNKFVDATHSVESVSVPTDEGPASFDVVEANVIQGGEEPVAVPVASGTPSAVSPSTDRQPESEEETIDSIMAEITAARPPSQRTQRRNLDIPSTTDVPTTRTPNAANRASLYDLPDPSDEPIDPFASPYRSSVSSSGAGVTDGSTTVGTVSSAVPVVETISPDGSTKSGDDKQGRSHLFKSRKKQEEESMSEWLGVDSDFDAKESGRKIGSWDNFDSDDDDGGSSWKGGAASTGDASEEELREAAASLGDDELLGHDIWFVATGASEDGHAGMNAFLDEHRDMLRGVFVVNLECVGAGQIAMVSTEGEKRVLKGDKRIMNIMRNVSESFHNEFGAVEMADMSTDAYAAMNRSLRALTLGGVDESGFACSHSGDDQVYNIDPSNVSFVSDAVTEFIRRS